MSEENTAYTLQKDHAAIVVSPDGDFELHIPDEPDDMPVPPPFLALVAVFLRMGQEPGFLEKQIDWMEARKLD